MDLIESDIANAIKNSMKTFEEEKQWDSDFATAIQNSKIKSTYNKFDKLDELDKYSGVQEKIFKNVCKYYSVEPKSDQEINMCAFWTIWKLLFVVTGETIWSFDSIIKIINWTNHTHPSECTPIGEQQTEFFLGGMLEFLGLSVYKRITYSDNTPEYVRAFSEDGIVGSGFFVSGYVILHSTNGDSGHFMLVKT